MTLVYLLTRGSGTARTRTAVGDRSRPPLSPPLPFLLYSVSVRTRERVRCLTLYQYVLIGSTYRRYRTGVDRAGGRRRAGLAWIMALMRILLTDSNFFGSWRFSVDVGLLIGVERH